MPDRYQETHIRQLPIFSQLPEHQFQLIARMFSAKSYNAGDYIQIQGTEAVGLIILAEGQLLRVKSAPDGSISQDGVIYEGQAIYPDALFQSVVADTHLQAIRPTTILELSRIAMSDLLAHHPELKAPLGLNTTSQSHHMHDVHFKTQRENEEVLLKTRRHWFVMARWIWAPFLLIIFGLLIAAGVPRIAFITVPAVFLFGIVGIVYIVMEWANDSVIITDQRVIRITHTILTFREVRNEVMLESIQEANAEIGSFDIFARIFRYGDIELKTAGSQGNFILDFLPNPEELQELIIEDARNYKSRSSSRERQTMAAEIDRWTNGDFQTGQSQNDAVSAQKIKNIYTPGDGPASPFKTEFPTKDGGIVYRKHWFIWIRAIAVPSVWIIGSLIGMLVLLITPLASIGIIGWITAFVAFLVGVVWFYLSDWDWRHDYYLITDNNVTIVNQRPLWLQNESDQILLQQVDNVVAETSGIFQQLFKYGDVRLALVGADTFKLFDNVANPRHIQSEITRRQQRLKQRKIEEQERAQRETIGEYISLYHERQQTPEQGQATAYPQDQVSAYVPSTPQAINRPAPSPFGRNNRPSMSAGRPYTPTNQVPPQASPYRPNPTPPQGAYQVPPQQGQYPPANPMPPQQVQYPPANPMPPQQGQYPP
ncbi:MAG: PH domain-containing protein, partial [Phototrophicaceae bacterium]